MKLFAFKKIKDNRNFDYKDSAVRQKELLDALLKIMPIGIFMVEAPSGKPLYANKEAFRLLGRAVLPAANKKNLGEVYKAYKLPERKPYPVEKMPIIKGMLGEDTHISDMVVVRPDGSESVLEVFGSPIRDAEGKIWASLASFVDISARVSGEDVIKASEAKFKAVFMASPDAIVLTRLRDGMVMAYNDGFKKLTGYNDTEIKGKTSLQLNIWNNPKTRNKLIAGLKKNTSIPEFEATFRKKDGSAVVGLMSAALFDLNNEPHILTLTRDITRRKQNEEKIRKGEILLRAMAESPRDMMIYAIDNKYKYLYFNSYHAKVMKNLYGIEPLVGKSILDCISDSSEQVKVKSHYDRVLDGERHVVVELIDASTDYYETSYNPIIDSENKVIGLTAFASDVTARTKVELALRESEGKYRTILNSISDAVVIHYIDKDGKPGNFIEVNDAACQKYGYTKEELLQMSPVDVDDPESFAKAGLPAIRELIKKGKVIFETTHLTKSGEKTTVEINATKININNKPAMLSIVRDITERKRLELKLHASLEHLEEVQRLSSIGNWEADIITGSLYWSKEIYNIFGLDSQSFKPSISAFRDAIYPDDREIVLESERRSEKTGLHDVVHRIVRPDGDIRYVHELAKGYNDEKGKLVLLRGTVQDITEQVMSEKALKESEEKFRNLFNNAEVGMFRTRLDGSEVLDANAKYLSILGMKREEFVGKPSVDIWVDPQERAVMVQKLKSAGYVNDFEFKLRNKTGDIRICLTSLKLYPDIGVLEGSLQDVTERKRAEEERNLASDKLAQIAKELSEAETIAGLGRYTLDVASGVWESSDLLDGIFGIDKKYTRDLSGWEALIHPDHRAMMHDYFMDEVLGKKKSFDKEYKIIRPKTQEERWVSGRGKLKLDKQGKVIKMVGIIIDITDKKLAERAESEFLYLASHQLRTPLSSIKWVLDVFNTDEGLTAKHKERLKDLYFSNQRLITLVDSLLKVSHIEQGKIIVKKETADLAKLINNCLKLLTPNAKNKQQKLKLIKPATLHSVKVDIIRFEEALSNLVSNAINYAPTGETISVTVSKDTAYYIIAVNNRGSLITSEEQKHLFTRFYRGTNAQRVKTDGTGLGLFIAKEAVEENDGKIWLESTEQDGTTFFFTVPISNGLSKIKSGGKK
ncbi:MAG: PAS domain S-box protein [Candidatus Falkowbacteria bacterium]